MPRSKCMSLKPGRAGGAICGAGAVRAAAPFFFFFFCARCRPRPCGGVPSDGTPFSFSFLLFFFFFFLFLRPAFDLAATAPFSPVFFFSRARRNPHALLRHSTFPCPEWIRSRLRFTPWVPWNPSAADRCAFCKPGGPPRVRFPGACVVQIARARGGEGAGRQTARRRRAGGR